MTWIKFCATTNLADALLEVEAGADALGFVFAPSARRIEPEEAKQIIASLGVGVDKIGVFVNQTPSHVAEVADLSGLTGVQLQGDEPPELLGEFRNVLGGRKIIKTLQAAQLLTADSQALLPYLRSAQFIDAILVDSGSRKERGGTGVPFDWHAAIPIFQRMKSVTRVIVAGGLNPENVAEAIRILEPWGVDVVSGVERHKGIKDREKLRRFAQAVREAKPAQTQ